VVQRSPPQGLPATVRRLAVSAFGKLARARAGHELKALERRDGASQTLRAFIQVNIQPRPR
jgi:hypothetical protein